MEPSFEIQDSKPVEMRPIKNHYPFHFFDIPEYLS